ncbi:DUF4325 domain-containing protein [Desulfobulbus rhabdoformis]|uniref:STAS-like domain-containing protein n=1 Tax=Desulfobulbus rhabdoformis TaxID=34032 RepID=UPI00196426D6|nr:DUF4325 domain-containing protein [Desulfobulbus rhabdoformis]MBM9614864.1 DUF4325 domain-containing protein [Desulfobulbus rhabdoformis]
MNTIIKIPNKFSFNDHGTYNFDRVLNIFNWTLEKQTVLIDFSSCFRANYQALSLLTLYIWHLRLNNCFIEFQYSYNMEGATKMWQLMGAKGWHHVLKNNNTNFNGNEYKPLIAVRHQKDFAIALSKTESYTQDFNVEYEKTLRYVISELLYNTLEHGPRIVCQDRRHTKIPSIIQFTWYKNKRQLQFIVADLGMGIKSHLEQAYPPFESHGEAILESLKYQVSGTFGRVDPYKSKDNAGVGLYISSNIIRRLNADMHVVSGDGLVHISPTDTTITPLQEIWPGTLVLVSLNLDLGEGLNLHSLMSEIRSSASKELKEADQADEKETFIISVLNFFGPYAENKQEAISFRDSRLLPSIEEGKSILIDFQGVASAPHSFLSALLATPIKRLGMQSYKRIKVVNSEPEIRETIDYILDDNTSA